MKRTIILFVSVMTLFLASCKKEVVNQLDIVTANELFSYEGGEGLIAVTTSSDLESAVSSESWVTTVVAKNQVALTVAANSDKNYRSATITVKNTQGLSKTVEIKQKGVKYIFDGKDVSFEAAATLTDIEYYASDKMALLIPDSAAGWLTGVVTANKLTLTVTENTSLDSRTASVAYAVSSKSGSFKVTQKGAAAYIKDYSFNDVEAEEKGCVCKYSFKTNSTLSASCDSSWVDLKVENDSLTVTVARNFRSSPREAAVNWSVARSEISGSFIVRQEAGTFSYVLAVTDSKGNPITGISRNWKAGNDTIYVSSNVKWTSSCADGWFSASPALNNDSGLDPVAQRVILTSQKNPSSTSRSSTISFTGENIADPVVISVSQNANQLVGAAVSSLNYSSMTATCTPALQSTRYLTSIVEKSELQQQGLETDDEAFFEYFMTQLKAVAESYGSSLEDLLDLILVSGTNTNSYTGLDPDTDYVLFAVAVEGLEMGGDLMRVPFTTPSIPAPDASYSALLGTWTASASVTSSGTTTTEQIQVTITQNVVNESVLINGLFDTDPDEDIPVLANVVNGNLEIPFDESNNMGLFNFGTSLGVCYGCWMGFDGKYVYTGGNFYYDINGSGTVITPRAFTRSSDQVQITSHGLVGGVFERNTDGSVGSWMGYTFTPKYLFTSFTKQSSSTSAVVRKQAASKTKDTFHILPGLKNRIAAGTSTLELARAKSDSMK